MVRRLWYSAHFKVNPHHQQQDSRPNIRTQKKTFRNGYTDQILPIQQPCIIPLKMPIRILYWDYILRRSRWTLMPFTYAGKFQLYQELWLKGRDILGKSTKTLCGVQNSEKILGCKGWWLWLILIVSHFWILFFFYFIKVGPILLTHSMIWIIEEKFILNIQAQNLILHGLL